jgi:N-acylneuraminate cytidylyltransferase
VARAHGADVPFLRPAELAADDAPEWLAWRHAIGALQQPAGAPTIDVFVSVPPTAPLRSPGDVDRCVRALLEHADTDVVLTVSLAARSPYFNMVTVGDDGLARLVIPPPGAVHRRQDAPRVWDITTVAYAARPRFVLERDGLFAGRVRTVEVPPERAIDIDTELDLVVAECLLGYRARGAGGQP